MGQMQWDALSRIRKQAEESARRSREAEQRRKEEERRRKEEEERRRQEEERARQKREAEQRRKEEERRRKEAEERAKQAALEAAVADGATGPCLILFGHAMGAAAAFAQPDVAETAQAARG